MIDDELRMADAKCLTECDVISVTKDEFNKYLNESNIFVRGVVGILSDRLRKIQNQPDSVARTVIPRQKF